MKNALEQALVERMRCPLCRGPLSYLASSDGVSAEARCQACGACYPRIDGIWRMLTPEEERQYAPFLEGYPVMRRVEGWERDEEYYLGLPNVKKNDPIAMRWRIRRRSLRILDRILQGITVGGQSSAGKSEFLGDMYTRQQWAFDLGAGSGWLSRHLARQGFNTVALDLNVSGIDSLAGGQLYLDREDIWFGRVQASMDKLPFADGAFAICIISSALPYANSLATLLSVWKVLRAGGVVVVSDSPVYNRRASGLAMTEEQRSRVRRLLGHDPPDVLGGSGFLVRSELVRQMREAGFEARVISTERLLGRARRFLLRLLRLLRPAKREEARVPVFVGTKVRVSSRGSVVGDR